MKFSQAAFVKTSRVPRNMQFSLKALEWGIWTYLSHLGVKQKTWWQIFLYQFSVVLRVWSMFCIFPLHFNCNLQKNSCVLPEDLKNFYLMTDGFQMTWSVKTDGESLCSPPMTSSVHCFQSFLCRTSLISLTFCTIDRYLSGQNLLLACSGLPQKRYVHWTLARNKLFLT